MYTPSSVCTSSEDNPTHSDNAAHTASVESNIQQVIDNIHDFKSCYRFSYLSGRFSFSMFPSWNSNYFVCLLG